MMSSADSSHPFIKLLGSSPTSPTYINHIATYHPKTLDKPESFKSFCEVVFYNYPSLGISYSFDITPTIQRLAAIHIYNAKISGYEKYNLDLSLPFGLDINMTGKEVVETLGEPSVKSKYPKCCIVYPDKGVQVDLAAKDWEEPNCSIECLTFYQEFA
ncbi:uncharacterized protein SPPG_00084 [Spizellomyces punctatus DAOM BR117]|uniref:Uncharacterized protein n=1 Tax=Spizellomyces punctatus (strain DAOM BR117) TaxID=645134 RepID=A0A0L0HU00_SPIPD|nr:uncharacterized protein SPPG_00084 [Spizellomyces punctatus DAOM BR117]KND04354.1 hypothetical protein SPPG_00084 [Spizellomyces punctatus DAOM BR117]|eukprot:XP_016612393.1 hypothetical protein SPPG_00084 [Spizellomyces punctatus DAOM BR117]